MTIIKHKKVSEVQYMMVSKKNTETDTVKNGMKIVITPKMLKAEDNTTDSCCKTFDCNVPKMLRAENSATKCCKAKEFNGVDALKAPNNAKPNYSKAYKSSEAPFSVQNPLKMKAGGLDRERKRAHVIDDKGIGKIIDLDEMTGKKTTERGVQAAKCDFEGKNDRLDHLKNRNINLIKMAEDDFAQRTENFRNMRNAMINNFNQTINIMNEQYERRKSTLFRMADENKSAMNQEQYNATRHFHALVGCNRQQ